MRGDIYLATRRELFHGHGQWWEQSWAARHELYSRFLRSVLPITSVLLSNYAQGVTNSHRMVADIQVGKKRARASIDSAAFLDAAQEVPK